MTLPLSFDRDGVARHACVAIPALAALEAAMSGIVANRAGVRLHGVANLTELLTANWPLAAPAALRLGAAATPVRAVLFDKSPGVNWALGWHQDRTVAVRARADLAGWGPWSVKASIQHVEPPFAIIERMVTLRIHLDPVPSDNAPLIIAPGSHRLGRIAEPDIDSAVQRCGSVACLAERGDIWAYATSILHASAASTGHAHRRVLQVDYAAGPLPPPLQWLGI